MKKVVMNLALTRAIVVDVTQAGVRQVCVERAQLPEVERVVVTFVECRQEAH